MLPSIRESNKVAYGMKCEMCSKNIQNKNNYLYISPILKVKLYICKDCAIREYYGSKRKQSKFYIRDLAANNIFGSNSRKEAVVEKTNSNSEWEW